MLRLLVFCGLVGLQAGFPSRCQALVLEPLFGQEPKFSKATRFIEELNGGIFLATGIGIWRLESADAKPVLLAKGYAQFVTQVSAGRIFLGTHAGIWRLDTADAQPKSVFQGRSDFLREVRRHIFVGNHQGIWRLDMGDADPHQLAPGSAQFVKDLGGRIFVGTDGGILRLDNVEAKPKYLVEGFAALSEEIGGRIYIGTSSAVWRLDNAASEPKLVSRGAMLLKAAGGHIFLGDNESISRLDESVDKSQFVVPGWARFVEEIGGHIFLGTHRGIWRFGSANAEPEFLAEGEARFVKDVAGHIFVGTSAGVWHMDRSSVKPKHVPVSQSSRFIKEIGGRIFVGTGTGIWRLESADAKPQEIVPGNATFVEELGGRIFIGSQEGVWRLDKADAKPERVTNDAAQFVKEAGGRIFLGTAGQTWRLYDASAKVTAFKSPLEGSRWAQPFSSLLSRTLIGTSATPIVQYVGPDKSLIQVSNPFHFKTILDTDRKNFDARVLRGDFVPDDTAHAVPVGFPTRLHVAILDGWGNRYEHTLEYFVLPTTTTIALLGLMMPPLIMLVALIWAPWSRSCHGLLMNPYVRGFASFGVVPLILTLMPPARRHVLKRHRQVLLASDDIKGWMERFIPPDEHFTAAAFSQRMREQNRILIVGSSGVGKTAFLRYITACGGTGRIDLNGVEPLPVYLALGRYGASRSKTSNDIASIIRGYLANLGEITDEKLADWMIRHGGFLFLFDGLNEVDTQRREEIAAFVEQYSSHNWFVASSQEAYSTQFGHWGAVQTMPRLTKDGIEALLTKRIGKGTAASLLAELDEKQLHLLSLPQNLELAMELTDTGKKLRVPDSEEALFSAVFERQFADWKRADNGDFVDLLSAQAYAMLRDRTAATLKKEIEDPLIARKILRKLGDDTYFRHDTLRAYVASEYFARNWQHLLKEDGNRIDSNWDSMLRFSVARLYSSDSDRDEIRDMLFELLRLSPTRAASVLRWLQEQHPEAVDEEFRFAFQKRLGEAVMEHLDNAA